MKKYISGKTCIRLKWFAPFKLMHAVVEISASVNQDKPFAVYFVCRGVWTIQRNFKKGYSLPFGSQFKIPWGTHRLSISLLGLNFPLCWTHRKRLFAVKFRYTCQLDWRKIIRFSVCDTAVNTNGFSSSAKEGFRSPFRLPAGRRCVISTICNSVNLDEISHKSVQNFSMTVSPASPNSCLGGISCL